MIISLMIMLAYIILVDIFCINLQVLSICTDSLDALLPNVVFVVYIGTLVFPLISGFVFFQEWKREVKNLSEITPLIDGDTQLKNVLGNLLNIEVYKPLLQFITKIQDYAWFINAEKVVLQRKLGEGGFGEVYTCLYKKQNCAVKKIRLSHELKVEDYSSIISEISILSTVNHECIVSFFGVYVEVETCFINIVMELLYSDLEKIIPKIKNDDWNTRLYVSFKIIKGLCFLHEKEIIHSDLKPSNVLVNKNLTQVKLADFGLSSVTSQQQSLINQGGTSHYMAPEQVNEKVLIYKSDVYAFGCLMYTLCFYEAPWKGLNGIQIGRAFSSGLTPVVNNKNIPDYLKEIIEQCLPFNPEHRPSSKELYLKMEKIFEEKCDNLYNYQRSL